MIDPYTITNNTITGNAGRGILFNNIGDADITTEITGNTISSNRTNGIQNTTVASVTDSPTIRLNIDNNTFNTNTGSGIALTSFHEATVNNNRFANPTGRV